MKKEKRKVSQSKAKDKGDFLFHYSRYIATKLKEQIYEQRKAKGFPK